MHRVGTDGTGRIPVMLISDCRPDAGGLYRADLRGISNGSEVGVHKNRQLSARLVVRHWGLTRMPRLRARRWKSSASCGSDVLNSACGDRFVTAIDPSESINPASSARRCSIEAVR